jgi:hypothetical protein
MRKIIACLLFCLLLACGGSNGNGSVIPVEVPPEPPASSTVLFLHMDGVNTGTIFTDSSASNHTVIAVGYAQTLTTNFKVGTAAGYFPNDGYNEDSYLIVPDSEDWHFGTSDFTIKTWVYFNSLGRLNGICGQYGDDYNYWAFAFSPHNFIFEAFKDGQAVALYENTSWEPTINTWYHIKLVRSDANVSFYVDDVPQQFITEVPISTKAFPDIAAVLEIGASYNHIWLLDGYLDEFQISKGS